MSVFSQMSSLQEPAPLYLSTNCVSPLLRVCCMLSFLTASSSGELRIRCLDFMDFLGICPFARKTAILTCSMTTKLLLLNSFPSGCDTVALVEVLRSKNRHGLVFLRFPKSTFLTPITTINSSTKRSEDHQFQRKSS